MEVALEEVAAFGVIASIYSRHGYLDSSIQGLGERTEELLLLGLLTLRCIRNVLKVHEYIY